MPTPSTNLVPKEEYWTFVQKDINPTQLVSLAKGIINNDGNVINDPTKASILSFLSGDPVQQWSDYWVTIINTLGIAYITSDSIIHKTSDAEYIANGGDLSSYFLKWSLYFQFPFAETKHKEFKEKNIVVNPCQIILATLVTLSEISKCTQDGNPFRESYLTTEEIVLVLMKLKSNSFYEIHRAANIIYNNRQTSFDYNTIKIQGHDTIISNFTGRARLYLEKSQIIKFSTDNQRIYVDNWHHYSQIQNYLSYRTAGSPISISFEEQDRVAYFSKSFDLGITPDIFANSVNRFNKLVDPTCIEIDEIKGIHQMLLNTGNYFTIDFVERFILSARTKPFVILSGISGVGKSLLPKAIMKLFENNSCRPIAVSPDWTDNSDMLGFFGADGKFVTGEFTNVVIEASNNLETPYFLVLDEMNLAKVEYYFAQVLSVMESRCFNEKVGLSEYSEYLFNVGTRNRLLGSSSKFENNLANLKIPFNLFIIGTVNIDESTHPFSKKVLDRANVLEINDVDLSIGVSSLGSSIIPTSVIPSSINYSGKVTNITELHTHWKLNEQLEAKYPFNVYIEKWIKCLDLFNTILKKHNLNFGLRMRDEVCIYLYYSALRNIKSTDTNWDNKYIDHQLVQKVLTKLEGEEGEIEDTLLEIFKACVFDESAISDYDSLLAVDIENEPNIKFPITAKKIQKMMYSLIITKKPIISFWSC